MASTDEILIGYAGSGGSLGARFCGRNGGGYVCVGCGGGRQELPGQELTEEAEKLHNDLANDAKNVGSACGDSLGYSR